MRLLLFCMFSAMLLFSTAHADSEQKCYTKGAKVNWDICITLLGRITAIHAKGEEVEGFRSCIPSEAKQEAVSRKVHSWVRKRPVFKRYNAYQTMSGALSVLYPCPK